MTVRRAAEHLVTDINSHTRASSQTLESSLLWEGGGGGSERTAAPLASRRTELEGFFWGVLLGVMSRLWLVGDGRKTLLTMAGRQNKDGPAFCGCCSTSQSLFFPTETGCDGLDSLSPAVGQGSPRLASAPPLVQNRRLRSDWKKVHEDPHVASSVCITTITTDISKE